MLKIQAIIPMRLLLGNKCGAHTVPYIKNKNSDSNIAHEATTSKISEDQLHYCQQRGLNSEGCCWFNCEWILQRSFTTTAYGVCR